jgi:hypothetical protein
MSYAALCIDLLNQRGMVQAGAEFRVLDMRFDPVDHRTGGTIRLPGLLGPLALGVQPP